MNHNSSLPTVMKLTLIIIKNHNKYLHIYSIIMILFYVIKIAITKKEWHLTILFYNVKLHKLLI